MKAIFLDRDGTLNVEKNYVYKIEDYEFLPGVPEGLKLLHNAGFLLIIITNQSGIARGYYSEEDFLKLNKWMCQELIKNGVNIDKIYYCPHHPQAKIERYRKKCMCRKPAVGLFYKAVEEYGIELSKSFAIGDKIRDCAICFQTACRGFLIGHNENDNIINSVKDGHYPRIKYSDDFLTCVKEIIKQSN